MSPLFCYGLSKVIGLFVAIVTLEESPIVGRLGYNLRAVGGYD